MFLPKKKLIGFLLALFCLNIYSQSAGKKIIDSLLIVSKKQTDKQKILTYIEVAEKYTGIDLDSAKFYSKKAYNLSLNIKDKRIETIAIIQLGSFARENSEYTKAIDYFKKSLVLSKEIKDTVLIANSYSGLGIVNSRLGNFKEAISNFLKGIPVYEKLKDTVNMARGYLNRKELRSRLDLLANLAIHTIKLREDKGLKGYYNSKHFEDYCNSVIENFIARNNPSFGKELSLIFSISSLPALERTRNALRDAELLDENGNVASTATIVCDGVPALLTHEQLSTILTIGSQFVEKLRRREAATIQQIIAGTITTKEQVDKINWV